MHEELYERWQDLASWVNDELMPLGAEGFALSPIGRHTKAATFLTRRSFSSTDFILRKIAATLAGYIENPEQTLLLELFDLERVRDASMSSDSIDRIYCQSVVEDIVFSAARWCRNPRLQTQGLALLSMLVEKTLAGEYWNTSSYAMATLCFYNTTNSQQLLKEFQTYSKPSSLNLFRKVKAPKHPSNPTLEQERDFAKGLTAGNPTTIKSIENLLDDKDKTANLVTLNDENKQWFEDFLQFASSLDDAPTI